MHIVPMGVYSILPMGVDSILPMGVDSIVYMLLDLSVHFNKFSGGSPTITEEDFARILLRHTTWELEPVFERLRRRAPPTAKVWTWRSVADALSVAEASNRAVG